MRMNAWIAGAVCVGAAVVAMELAATAAPRAQTKPRPFRAAPRANAPKVTAMDTLQASARIPAAFAARMRAPSSRDVMVRSLLGDPGTRSAVSAAAAARGVTPEALLAGAPGQPPTALKSTYAGGTTLRKVIARLPQAAARPKTADDEAYDRIDWKSGVTFAPDSMPRYGPAGYALGALEAHYAAVASWEPQVMFLEPPYTENSWYGTVNLYMELPMEPAMYLIAVKVTARDGSCPASWVQPDGFGYSPLNISVTGASEPTKFTPLLDGSGYVGVCSLDRQYAYPAEYRGMRQTTASISIMVSRWKMETAGSLIFGGVTITKI